MFRMLTLSIAALVLAGCGEEQELPTRPFTDPGVQFSVTPSAARDCDPDTVYRGAVEWELADRSAVRLEIRIDSMDGPLFARSNEPKGRVETEEWIRRGLWFLLVDRSNGRIIAAQRAGPEHCD